MSIASDAPAAHTPSVMRSALLRRKIRGRCVRSSVSSAAGSYGKRRKVSITISLRRHATSGAVERESDERSSRCDQEIPEAAMPRTARLGGVSEMLHRTIVRRADRIEDTVDSLVRNRVASQADVREDETLLIGLYDAFQKISSYGIFGHSQLKIAAVSTA